MFELTQTFGSMAEVSGSEDTSETKKLVAKLILRERRRRNDFFRSELFGEPAWDMLLELYVHHLDQSRISVSGLCSFAGVPATTALRWIGNLERAGLVMRRKDFMDGRRFWIELTSDGITAVDRYFDGLTLLV
jgi:DNA-binding MarR family transcriptional regulator